MSAVKQYLIRISEEQDGILDLAYRKHLARMPAKQKSISKPEFIRQSLAKACKKMLTVRKPKTSK
jgi:hypothetical protein